LLALDAAVLVVVVAVGHRREGVAVAADQLEVRVAGRADALLAVGSAVSDGRNAQTAEEGQPPTAHCALVSLLHDAPIDLVTDAIGIGRVKPSRALQTSPLLRVARTTISTFIPVLHTTTLAERIAVLATLASIVHQICGATLHIANWLALPLEEQLSLRALRLLGGNLKGYSDEGQSKQ
jgi:hypothetical protein